MKERTNEWHSLHQKEFVSDNVSTRSNARQLVYFKSNATDISLQLPPTPPPPVLKWLMEMTQSTEWVYFILVDGSPAGWWWTLSSRYVHTVTWLTLRMPTNQRVSLGILHCSDAFCGCRNNLQNWDHGQGRVVYLVVNHTDGHCFM